MCATLAWPPPTLPVCTCSYPLPSPHFLIFFLTWCYVLDILLKQVSYDLWWIQNCHQEQNDLMSIFTLLWLVRYLPFMGKSPCTWHYLTTQLTFFLNSEKHWQLCLPPLSLSTTFHLTTGSVISQASGIPPPPTPSPGYEVVSWVLLRLVSGNSPLRQNLRSHG